MSTTNPGLSPTRRLVGEPRGAFRLRHVNPNPPRDATATRSPPLHMQCYIPLAAEVLLTQIAIKKSISAWALLIVPSVTNVATHKIQEFLASAVTYIVG